MPKISEGVFVPKDWKHSAVFLCALECDQVCVCVCVCKAQTGNHAHSMCLAGFPPNRQAFPCP